MTKITKLTFTVMLHFYLRTSRSWTPCPSGTRKRKAGRSDSIRSIGVDQDHARQTSEEIVKVAKAVRIGQPLVAR